MGGADDDQLDGGAGTDIAVYAGIRDEFNITDNGDGSYTVQDLIGGRNGTDIVRNVEFYHFDDGTIGEADILTGNPNFAPVAVDDTGSMLAGQSIAVDVLANDTDANNDTLTITNATITSGLGSVMIIGGEVVYDVGTGDGTPYIAIRFVPGESLSHPLASLPDTPGSPS